MNEITNLIMQQLGGGGVARIGQQIGADEATTQNAITAALPVLVSALARNASDPQGAEALHGALNRDQHGGLLDDLMGFLGGGGGPMAAGGGGGGATDGFGILGHILGGQQQTVEQGVSRASGLDFGKVGPLLALLAPLVMGALGRAQRQNGFDAGGLSGYLGSQQQQAQQTAPDLMGMASVLLDGNRDGSVLDDVAGMAGRFFGR